MAAAGKDYQRYFDRLNLWQRNASSAPIMAGTRVLIFGALGHVGICALDAWLKAGAEVVALARQDHPGFAHPKLTWLKGDLTDPASLQGWGALPEILVCCAPLALLPPVVSLLMEKGVKRVVAFSSTSLHTKTDSGDAEERAFAEKLRVGEAALFAEPKLAVTILRPTLIYGIGLDKNVTVLARLIRRLPFFPLPLNARGLRQPVHAMDLAQATINAVRHPATVGKAYDVGGAERMSYRAMVARIARTVGRKTILMPIPFFAEAMDLRGRVGASHTGYSYGEAIRRMGRDMVFDDHAARADFGWSPRGFLDEASQPADTPFFG